MESLKHEDFIQALLKEGDVYLVGGCVRDFIMSKTPKDIDILVTNISLPNLHEILSKFGTLDFVGVSFGITKFKPFGYVGEPYDISIPRKDTLIDRSLGHVGIKAEFDHTLTVYDDLHRRDFTINSIAYDVRTGDYIDPHNGINDICNRIIRPTSIDTFTDDPLRILRALQFSARFGFDISDECDAMIERNKSYIRTTISGERILGEIDKAYKTDIYSLLEKYDLFELRERIENIEINNIHDFRFSIFTKRQYQVFGGEALTLKYMDILEKLALVKPNDYMKVFDMIRKVPQVVETGYKTDFDISVFKSKFPKNYNELQISGDILMKQGYTGQQVGARKKELLIDVFEGRRRNLLCDLIK